jgi:hypothetical protein
MERRTKVELFEQIRREYEFGVGTIRAVAQKLGVHRRMVRQALASAEPPARKRVKRERPAIGPVQPFIDAILEADRTAPRKQRHTAHRIAGRQQQVGALMIEERTHLLPLAEQDFELTDIAFPRVDGLGCVRVRTNLYSAPAAPGKTVEVRLYPSHVEIRDEGRCIARHERCYERCQQVLDLEHYLDVLERKPGALIGSKPLAAWRARGLWPESYDRLLAQLIERHGQSSGTRQMIQVLNLIRPHSHARVRSAVEEAIALGCADAAAVRHLVEGADLIHARDAIIELGALSRFERPAPVMTDYDGLLGQEVAP